MTRVSDKKPAASRLRRRMLCALLIARGGVSLLGINAAVGLNASTVFAQEKQSQSLMNTNAPLLQPWQGPYGGVPPWNLVRVEEFASQFDQALKIAEDEIAAIANQTEPATFENTILAIDSAGQTLERLETLFDVHTSNLNIGPIPDIERIVAPKLSAYSDSIIQNEKLFQRIEAVYQGKEMATLSPAQQRLVDDKYKTFVRRGAKLSPEDKAKLSQINMRLARLFTDFNQNVLEDEKRYITWIHDSADLAGLPESTIAAMASAASEADASGDNKKGKWAVTNTRSSMDPFLTYAANRSLREQVWRNYYSRCDHDDQFDNKQIIREIVGLRLSRAKLLGYPTHAHWRMEPTMAKDPQAAIDLMMKVWPKAVARVREEVADMQAIADREAEMSGSEKITIQPWDYRYYAEKVRKEKYDLDFNEVEPYLQLNKLRDAMMWVAEELWGLRFEPVSGLPVFHPDVKVWEVKDREGQHVGLWYFDPYARTGKRSGAWMSDYRAQQRIPQVVSPIVSNNSNFVKSGDGQVVLISWDDAVTLFHEFGHALHGLLSDVDYKAQSGTRVARDYVEFPSQVLEHWLPTTAVLEKYALHYQTGEPMPEELLQKIRNASQFNQGFGTVEYLASAIVDMKMHTHTAGDIDPDQFERETLKEIGMPAEMVMRHRTPHFSHLFSSDSYSAGYYSYLWSDALTADAAEVFEEAEGGYFDPEVANSLRDHVLSVGDTIDPAESFRRFRGRDVDTGALLRKRGFPTD